MHLLSRLMPSTNGKLKIFLVALGYASATTHKHLTIKCNSCSINNKERKGVGNITRRIKSKKQSIPP